MSNLVPCRLGFACRTVYSFLPIEQPCIHAYEQHDSEVSLLSCNFHYNGSAFVAAQQRCRFWGCFFPQNLQDKRCNYITQPSLTCSVPAVVTARRGCSAPRCFSFGREVKSCNRPKENFRLDYHKIPNFSNDRCKRNFARVTAGQNAMRKRWQQDVVATKPHGPASPGPAPRRQRGRARGHRSAPRGGRGVGRRRENPAHAPCPAPSAPWSGGRAGWLGRSACARARRAAPVTSARSVRGTHKSVSFNFFF